MWSVISVNTSKKMYLAYCTHYTCCKHAYGGCKQLPTCRQSITLSRSPTCRQSLAFRPLPTQNNNASDPGDKASTTTCNFILLEYSHHLHAYSRCNAHKLTEEYVKHILMDMQVYSCVWGKPNLALFLIWIVNPIYFGTSSN